MTSLGLSLISQPKYTKSSLNRIKDLGFSHISVTPQQLGLLEPSSYTAEENLSVFRYAQSIGLQIHSIQGLFYGIRPDSENLNYLLNERLSKLADCASSLAIPHAVLGSPDFRKSPSSWDTLMTTLDAFENIFTNGIHMENICLGSASCDLSANYPTRPSLAQVSCMLDVSNLLSCKHVPVKSFVNAVTSTFCHISSAHHHMPQNQNEFEEILSILNSFPKVSVLIWEIFSSDIEEMFKLMENFNQYLKS
jgi:hypothetical protein